MTTQPTDEEILAAYRERIGKGTPTVYTFFSSGYLAGHAKAGKVEVRWRNHGSAWSAWVGGMAVAYLMFHHEEQRWRAAGILGAFSPGSYGDLPTAKAALTAAIEAWFEKCLEGE
jgi:hypothetical protein